MSMCRPVFFVFHINVTEVIHQLTWLLKMYYIHVQVDTKCFHVQGQPHIDNVNVLIAASYIKAIRMYVIFKQVIVIYCF